MVLDMDKAPSFNLDLDNLESFLAYGDPLGITFSGLLQDSPPGQQQPQQNNPWLFYPSTATFNTEPAANPTQHVPSPPTEHTYSSQPASQHDISMPSLEPQHTFQSQTTPMQDSSHLSPAIGLPWPVLPSAFLAPGLHHPPTQMGVGVNPGLLLNMMIPLQNAAAPPPPPAAPAPSKSRVSRVRPQQTLAGMQAELARKQAEFKSLTVENAQLQQKLRILDAVVPIRTDNVNFLSSVSAASSPAISSHPSLSNTTSQQQHQQQRTQGLSRLNINMGAALQKSRTCSSDGKQGEVPVTSSPGSHSSMLNGGDNDEYAALLEHTRQAMLQHHDQPNVGETARESLPDCSSISGSCLDVYETSNMLQSCTPLMFQRLWKDFLKETAMFVIASECHGLDDVCQEVLESRITQAMVLIDKAMLLHPEVYFQSMYVNMESKKQERPKPEFWTAVAKCCRISTQQAEDIIAALKGFSKTIAPVVQERTAITAALAVQLAGGHQVSTKPPSALAPFALSAQQQPPADSTVEPMDVISTSGIASARTAAAAQQAAHTEDWETGYTSLHALSAALKRNVMQEHAAHMTLSDYLSFNVLTKMQLARISASSYPYMPDALGIMLCDSGRVLVEAGVSQAMVASVLKDM